MTYDVSNDETEGRRWCERCRIGVDPIEGDRGLECPSCGKAL